MQVSLILYAEHEFNASTFTARVIASTGASVQACVIGAAGALILIPSEAIARKRRNRR